MELHQLTQHCYWSDPVHHGDRPSLGLIAGAESTLAVDTGNGPGHAHWLLGQAEKLGLPPVRWAVLTHWHWDHIMGARAMQERDISLICTRGTQRQLRLLTEYQWDDQSLDRRVEEGIEIPFCRDAIRVEYPDQPRPLDPPLPDMVIEGPAAIDLEGVTVRLLPHPSDYSMDGLLVQCTEDRVVFLGDSLYYNMYTSPWHYTPEKLMPLLVTLQGRLRGTEWYLQAHHDKPMSQDEFGEFCTHLRTCCRLAEDELSLSGPAARFAAEFGRQPNPQETEDLLAFVRGNIVKER